MESVGRQMIELIITKCDNAGIIKGLELALEIISFSGYYDINEWEDKTEEERLQEVEIFLED